MSLTANQLRESIDLGDDDPDSHDLLIGQEEEEADLLVGATSYIRMPNGGYRAVSAQEKVKYGLLSPAAKLAYQKRYAPTCATVAGKPPGYYTMVETPGGISLRMAKHLASEWSGLTPAQQRSLLWRATRNAGTLRKRQLPCL